MILGIIFALALFAALALWIAVQHNGPTVVDRLDQLTGPASMVEPLHRETLGAAPSQKLIVYRDQSVSGSAPLPVFIFVHGGGWHNGDPDDYGFIARNIAPEGYIVVLAGYRLAESGRYPAMLEDTAAAIGWVHRNIARFGGDPQRIVLGGHSAGAYNVVETTLDSRWLEGADVNPAAIRGVVGLAGPYDFYPFDTDTSRAIFGSVDAGPDSQPINHVHADAPPMLLVHGEDDDLVKPRNSRALAARMDAAGAPVETLFLAGKGHNPPLLMLSHPWRRDPRVFDAVTAFLHRTTQVSVPVQGKTS